MAMLIAWQICNKVSYPLDKRFSKNVFIVAPGLTVKSRLQVLLPGGDDNYYTRFSVVPEGLFDKLNQGKIIIENWHTLAWDTEEQIAKKKSVDRRGAKSIEVYTREVLGGMSNAHNILVINDEAHHAWRINPETKVKKNDEAVKEATIWVGGLDRIHKARGILTCYDFSATPFAPSGKKNDEEALFTWIVSDFGLNDGIEAGLVKTPRVVVRDDAVPDAATYKSKLYHLYMADEIRDNINQSAPPEQGLPDLLRNAYELLGADWKETYKAWREADTPTPPVMLSVANRTETAARIKYAFDHKKIHVAELCDERYTIQVDSTKVDEDSELREIADTVGQKGKPGEQIRNVISVAMLSEGWDAKTVTHILGLRAFSSQLLCEQVVGRGLRRVSYDRDEGNELFEPEYVNIFGIPFSFLPHESNEGGAPKPPKPKTQVEALKERTEYEISFPHITRLERMFKPTLSVNLQNMETLVLDSANTRLKADLAAIVEGKPDYNKLTQIDLERLDSKIRMQKIIFSVAGEVYERMQSQWKEKATRFALFGQVVRLVEDYVRHGFIQINPPLLNTDSLRRRILFMLNMNKIVEHVWQHIELEMTESVEPIFGDGKRIRSTADMMTWYTTKPCRVTRHSHISHCVFDSAWEDTESYKLENNPNVAAWVKNDHIGFDIVYTFEGIVRRYYPDFLIRLTNGKMLVLETKGQKTRQSDAKRAALEEWVKAVNCVGEYGEWASEVSYHVGDVDGIIKRWA
jgi:type III restriction enzyme